MLAQHANPREFQHYASGLPTAALARYLRCSTATARAWASGKRPPPWWAVAVLRLDALEREEMARQMGYARMLPRLGVVRGDVIDMHRPRSIPTDGRLLVVTGRESSEAVHAIRA